VVGFAGGQIQSAALNHALVKNYSIVGLHWGLYTKKGPVLVRICHDELSRLAAQGVVKPLVSERLPLAAVADGLPPRRRHHSWQGGLCLVTACLMTHWRSPAKSRRMTGRRLALAGGLGRRRRVRLRRVPTTPVRDSIAAWLDRDGIDLTPFSRALKAWLSRLRPGRHAHPSAGDR